MWGSGYPGSGHLLGTSGECWGGARDVLSLHQEADAILDPSHPLASEGDTTHGHGEMTQQPTNCPGHAGGRDQQGA